MGQLKTQKKRKMSLRNRQQNLNTHQRTMQLGGSGLFLHSSSRLRDKTWDLN
jgi:hypothetical protein